MTRAFAEDTSVPVERSQAEIARLLRDYGCLGVQWAEDWTEGTTILRFCWPHEGARYLARITSRIPPDAEIRSGCTVKHRTPEAASAWLAKARDQRARQAMRLVLLKLKADFNMVRAGMVSAVEILLPFLENDQGRTLAEVAVPLLPELFGGSTVRMLGGPS